MYIVYKDKDVEKTCTNLYEAKKKLPYKTAKKLLQAINFIKSADSLQDVVLYPPFHFHGLKGQSEGLFAIDIDGRKSSYRLILKPVGEETEDIVAIAKSVKIISVWEVSKHYE